MKKLLLSLSFGMFFQAMGQSNYTITANGNNWSDELIYINVGDSITFINNSGQHNVNGTQQRFPTNPESFGHLKVGNSWIYGFRFNISGVYSYVCDMQPGTMGGVVVVEETASLNESNLISDVYPNPTDGILNLSNAQNSDLIAYDLLGNIVFKRESFNGSQIDLSFLNPGSYFLIITNGVLEDRRRIVKK